EAHRHEGVLRHDHAQTGATHATTGLRTRSRQDRRLGGARCDRSGNGGRRARARALCLQTRAQDVHPSAGGGAPTAVMPNIAASTASLRSFRFSKRTITPKTLGDRGFASTDGLPDLETLELRMVDVERLVLAGILVGGAKCLRLGPRFEGTPVPPDRMRGIECEVLVLGSLQQVEFEEARHLVELRVAAEPYLLERLFRSPP